MRVELLCLDVDGTMTDGKLFYGLNLGNLVLGMQFRTCGNFRTSTDTSLVESPKISTNTKATPQSLPLRFYESQNLGGNSAQNAESSLDSAISQNLNQNNSARSAHLESRPLRGAKNREQGCSSATADFLLEADKRGSPPKSEKAAAFWRVGGAGWGVQPFLREETRENNSEENAESRLDSAILSQSGLPRSPALARNDGVKSPQDEFGEVLKVFNAKDGLALAYWCKSLNRNAAIITGKKSEILRHRAKELGIKFLFMGVKDKGKVLRGLKKDLALDSAQVACVGDDLNDISMFAESSLNFAPHDCTSHLKTLPNITILNTKGGKGAVREAIEIILQKEGIYEDFTSFFAR